jgi:hypothetical protein
MSMGLFSISTLVLTPLKLEDEDPLLNANKLSIKDLDEVSHSSLTVKPIQKLS